MQKQFLSFLILTLLTSIGYSQITIEGTVFGENKTPLVAASVLIKNSSLGAMTDLNGKFVLSSQQSLPLTLIVSYTGYKQEEIKVTSTKNPLEIFLRYEMEVEVEDVVIIGQPEADKKISTKMRAMERDRVMYVPHRAPMMSNSYSDSAPNWNTEDYDIINENRFYEVNKAPLSTFSIDVDASSYSNMRRFIQNGQKPPKDAIRIEEMLNYFNYQYPQPQGEHPFEVVTEVSDCPWNKDHRLFHIGLQGKKVATENLPASNLVFLIDVSGSMNAQNKLPLLQSSFKLLVDQLREQDKVAIVVYAGAAGMVLPPTNGTDKQKIKEAIMNLSAGGSTAGAAGIQLAYKIAKENFVKGGNNRVILATDGDFNIGTSSDAELTRLIEEKREDGVFLTVMGFGAGNYKDNKMQQLANSGNGNHAYIDNISEAKKVLVNEFGGTLFTIAKDVKLQLEFNPAKVEGYRLIGYENRMLENEEFNDDKKDAGDLGSGHTVTAIYEIIPAGVKSEFITKVDDLKYQKTDKTTFASKSPELLTIKLRYKKPDGSKSILMEKPVIDTRLELKESTDNFRWSAAVAGFGMLLRDSEFKKDANYKLVIDLAKAAKGKDENGYRAELIRMMETIRDLEDGQMNVGMRD